MACEKNEKDKFSFYGNVEGTIMGSDDINRTFPSSSDFLKGAEIIFDRGDIRFVDYADENGVFSFDGIPYGSYNISVSHSLYSSQYQLGYQLYFTDTLNDFIFYLHKQSSISKIYSAEIEKASDNTYWLDMDCNGNENERVVYTIFFSEDENVSYKNYQFHYSNLDWSPYSQACLYDLLEGYSEIYFAIYPLSSFNEWVEPETREKFTVEFNPKVEYIGHYEEN